MSRAPDQNLKDMTDDMADDTDDTRGNGGEQPHGIDPRPACVRPAGGESVGELSKVYVDSTMRGSGLTPALMDAVTRQAGAHGTGLLWLGTHVTNKRAQKA